MASHSAAESITDHHQTSPDQTRKADDEKPSAAAIGDFLPGWVVMGPMRKKKERAARRLQGTESALDADLSSDGEVANHGKIQGVGESKIPRLNGYGETEVVDEEVRSDDELLGVDDIRPLAGRRDIADSRDQNGRDRGSGVLEAAVHVEEYKVYKRRFFGMLQLVLLNIIVSWDWLSFSANSNTCAQYYNVSESAINWLSTSFLFAFVVVSPLTIRTLHHGGPRPAIITASILILAGNWIRYGATRAGSHGSFGGVMFGQILNGLAQPYVLSAPTRYSDLWFTNQGRVAATAVMSLANPLGGALAQLINPFWADRSEEVPNMVLYITIISSVATIPSFFIPSGPPTPVSPSFTTPKQKLGPSLRSLFTSPEFYMMLIPFTVLVGLFNSISSVINQVLEPYSFTETQAGIGGALLIIVGLLTAAITSPIIDRTKSYLFAIKTQVPIIALCYLTFVFVPSTRNVAAVCVILAILGAASFSLVPISLEYLIELTHPVSPEVTSTICWSGGQLLGGTFIVVSDALRDKGNRDGSEDDGTTRPPGNMFRALVLQAVLAVVIVPLPLALGCCGRRRGVRMRRVEADKLVEQRRGEVAGEAVSP